MGKGGISISFKLNLPCYRGLARLKVDTQGGQSVSRWQVKGEDKAN